MDHLQEEFFHLFLIFCRIAGLFVIAPGFSSPEIPGKIRILIMLCMSIFVGSCLPHLHNADPFMLIMVKGVGNFLIGLFFGLIARMFFALFDVAAQVISLFLNLSNAVLFNPSLGGQASLIGTFFHISGFALLFALGWHHSFIQAIVTSYSLVPSFQSFYVFDGIPLLLQTMQESFRIGLHLAAPVFVIGIIFHVVFGIINRILPQIQIFFISIPLQILIGLSVLAGSLWFGFEMVQDEANQFASNLFQRSPL